MELFQVQNFFGDRTLQNTVPFTHSNDYIKFKYIQIYIFLFSILYFGSIEMQNLVLLKSQSLLVLSY